jgi:hypothetical protein
MRIEDDGASARVCGTGWWLNQQTADPSTAHLAEKLRDASLRMTRFKELEELPLPNRLEYLQLPSASSGQLQLGS